MTTIDPCADEWNQCIACGAARASQFFCQACLDSKVDEELMRDNPILQRAQRDAGAGQPDPRGGACKGKRRRSPEEIAEIQVQLQWLADHPGVVERLHGHHELDGLRHLPQDSRRPTDPTAAGRFMADYGSPSRDQRVNWGILL
jgi:hypothetical protein